MPKKRCSLSLSAYAFDRASYQYHLYIQVEEEGRKFALKLSEVFNQTTPSRELVRNLTHEFFEDTYETLLNKVDGDVRYLDTSPLPPVWGQTNARELVLSTLLLTGSGWMQPSEVA